MHHISVTAQATFILEDRVCESPNQIGTHSILLLLPS